jgi:hypothetical protein
MRDGLFILPIAPAYTTTNWCDLLCAGRDLEEALGSQRLTLSNSTGVPSITAFDDSGSIEAQDPNSNQLNLLDLYPDTTASPHEERLGL